MCVTPRFLQPAEQIFHARRNQSAERNLESQGGNIDVVVAARRRMQIEPIVADANRIGELFCLGRSAWKELGSSRETNMLFENRKFRFDAARFADVWRFGKPIGSSDDVLPEPETLPACLSIAARRLSLHPIEPCQT